MQQKWPLENLAVRSSQSRENKLAMPFVTTEQFLVAFDLESLQDLPDREQLQDAGLFAERQMMALG